jgi:hypothetical protein
MFELSRTEELGSDSPGKRWIIEGWESDERTPFLTNPDATLADAREWAEQMLAETTDYRVTGWSACTPSLVKNVHTLETVTAETTDSIKLKIATGAYAKYLIGMLGDPNAVWVVEHGTGTFHIPVRHITFVNHVITTIQV